MALGYETTGTAPNLIANAGNAMAADIRRIGETIRRDIQQHNQDKQVFGFLQEAKTLDPAAPDFQQQLVGVFAKYPSAAQDQRALTGAKFLHDAWEQKQLKDKLQMQFSNQKELALLRNGGANRIYGQGEGGLRTGTGDGVSPTGMQAEPAGVNTMFNVGSQIMGGLGGQMNTPLGVPFRPPADDLPVSGGVVGEDKPNALFNKELDSTLKTIKVDEREGRRIMARDAAARARATGAGKPNVRLVDGNLHVINPDGTTKLLISKSPKGKGIFMSEDGPVELLDNHQWRLPDGTLSDTAPAGVTRIPGAMDEANAKAREGAATERTENREVDRALKITNSKISEKETQLRMLNTRINKTRDELDKEENPKIERLKELGVWQKQFTDLQKEIFDLQAAREDLGIEKTLDKDTAIEILKEAGGDREKAEALARSRGYKL